MNRFHNWYCRSILWRRTVQRSLLPWTLDGILLGDDVLEVGPGPGVTTDVLKEKVPKLTAIEFDRRLAARLRGRLAGTYVTIVTGDATKMPFEPNRFKRGCVVHHAPPRAITGCAGRVDT